MADKQITILIRARDAASRVFRGVRERVQTFGGSVRRLVSGPLARLAAAFSAGFAVQRAVGAMASFERTMAEVATIAPGATSQVNVLRESILQLTKEVPQSADQLGAGAYQLLSSGVTETADVMSVLTASSKAAVAGLTDTATAVDAVTTILNAWSLEASEANRVTDILFETVRLGKLRFADIAGSIGNAATSAALAGVTVEELTAAMATMTLAGVNTQEATSSLNRLFLTLVQQTDAQAEAFRNLGIEFNLATVQERGFAGLLQEVNKLTDGQIEVLGELFPNIRAARSAFVLAGNNLDRYREILDQTNAASGSAERAFDTMNQTLDNQIKLLRNELNVELQHLAVNVLPLFKGAIGEVTEAIEGWRFLFGELPRQIGPSIASLSRETLEARVQIMGAQAAAARQALEQARADRERTRNARDRMEAINRERAAETDLQQINQELGITIRALAMRHAEAATAAGDQADELDRLDNQLDGTADSLDAATEAADKLEAALQMEDAQVALDQMRSKVERLTEKTETAAKDLSGVDLETPGKRAAVDLGKGIESEFGDQMQRIGAQGATQLFQGMISKSFDMQSLLNSIFSAVIRTAVFSAFGIGSPSKLGIDTGRNLAQSIGRGFRLEQKAIEQAIAVTTSGLAISRQIGALSGNVAFRVSVGGGDLPTLREMARVARWLEFMGYTDHELRFHGYRE